jgi:hypothetical protein
MLSGRIHVVASCWVAAFTALLIAWPARAHGEPTTSTIYVSPGLLYSALDKRNGGRALGAELSIPWAVGNVALGPIGQLQWSPGGLHGMIGAEIVVSLLAVEAGWFRHSGADGHQGLSLTVLFGYGIAWFGPRLTIPLDGAKVSGTLNVSLKLPIAVRGCHWYRREVAPTGCR